MDVLEKRIPKIFSRISDVADFRRITAEMLKGEGNVVVTGMPESTRALFIAGLWQSLRRPLIVVTGRDRSVSSLASDIDYFHTLLSGSSQSKVSVFPAWEV